MASGHVNRINRPNTWLHRPMLHSSRKSLPTRSRPHMALSCRDGERVSRQLSGVKRTPLHARAASASLNRDHTSLSIEATAEAEYCRPLGVT